MQTNIRHRQRAHSRPSRMLSRQVIAVQQRRLRLYYKRRLSRYSNDCLKVVARHRRLNQRVIAIAAAVAALLLATGCCLSPSLSRCLNLEWFETTKSGQTVSRMVTIILVLLSSLFGKYLCTWFSMALIYSQCGTGQTENYSGAGTLLVTPVPAMPRRLQSTCSFLVPWGGEGHF